MSTESCAGDDERSDPTPYRGDCDVADKKSSASEEMLASLGELIIERPDPRDDILTQSREKPGQCEFRAVVFKSEAMGTAGAARDCEPDNESAR